MGLFRKESKTHFERDKEGRVIRVTRNSQDITNQPRWKSSKQLEREYYEAHPEEKHKTLKKVGRVATAIDKKVVAHNRRNAPPGMFQGFSTPQYSTRNNYNPFGSVFDTGMEPMKKPKITHKKKTSTKKKSAFGFDLTDNWGFMK